MTVKRLQNSPDTVPAYRDNLDQLRDALRRLDLLIQRRTVAFREAAPDPLRTDLTHVYISHEEVDHLLRSPGTVKVVHPEGRGIEKALESLGKEIHAKVTQSLRQGVFLALPQLAHIFSLSPFECDVLIICLAPELDRKYDKLYAYLQDDITRKKPSVDLALDLLCASETARWQGRNYFSSQAPLFRTGLLQFVEDMQSPSGSSDLSRFLKLDPRILSALLGSNHIDAALSDVSRLILPQPDPEPVFIDPAIHKNLLRFMQRHLSDQSKDRKKLAFHFHGPYGVGKKELAATLCGALNIPLLIIDTPLLLKDSRDIETPLRNAFREGLLQQAALFLEGIDIFNTDNTPRFFKTLHQAIAQYGWLCFLAGEAAWTQQPGLFQDMLFQSVHLPVPADPLQRAAWDYHLSALDAAKADHAKDWPAALAGQFRLSPGQMRDAVQSALARRALDGGESGITLGDLFSACREQSNQKLHEMARKINPRADWGDIILPESHIGQLKEICAQVKHRTRVFGDWGFDRKLSYGKGLSVLFSGPPGTGKTLAAEVIAHALGLDCYKIDLSGLVSKYIGETEKNLAKVFREAETSNAILFFDEADALFGKRTEVSDAHDRYANIETSYLLQKMEEYEGIVILATNLRDNMDEAFTRRIRFIVEFPFPDAAHRLAIWKRHFPKEAPVDEAMDYEWLSKKVQVAGGNIKNIVLNAAFLAAENGQVIGMDHLIQGTRREYEKIGKLWDDNRLDPAKEKAR